MKKESCSAGGWYLYFLDHAWTRSWLLVQVLPYAVMISVDDDEQYVAVMNSTIMLTTIVSRLASTSDPA